MPSTTDADQSIAPAALRRSSTASCAAFHTPAACQSRSRLHAVVPEQPSSRGRCAHAIPVTKTKAIALKHTRSGTGRRPSTPAESWARRPPTARRGPRTPSPPATSALAVCHPRWSSGPTAPNPLCNSLEASCGCRDWRGRRARMRCSCPANRPDGDRRGRAGGRPGQWYGDARGAPVRPRGPAARGDGAAGVPRGGLAGCLGGLASRGHRSRHRRGLAPDGGHLDERCRSAPVARHPQSRGLRGDRRRAGRARRHGRGP